MLGESAHAGECSPALAPYETNAEIEVGRVSGRPRSPPPP
jgi:hypothetical protein